ncbi:MAG: hypothetical protein OEX01_08110 [Candidatus Bathyarchaeota archaeon]|nr:hypothetical protein [Candidatus Bathyarchaeota archaeon]
MVKEKMNVLFLPVAMDIKYRDVEAEDLFICNKTDKPLTHARGEEHQELQDEGILKCPSLNLQ